MDKFIETSNLPRLNHDGIQNLNRLIIAKEIELVIKNLSTNRNAEPNEFTNKFFFKFKVEYQFFSNSSKE